jgi:hypothetical protein
LILLGLLGLEDEGDLIFQNVRNGTPNNTASLNRRLESLAIPLRTSSFSSLKKVSTTSGLNVATN